jgi:hypothetical protein
MTDRDETWGSELRRYKYRRVDASFTLIHLKCLNEPLNECTEMSEN